MLLKAAIKSWIICVPQIGSQWRINKGQVRSRSNALMFADPTERTCSNWRFFLLAYLLGLIKSHSEKCPKRPKSMIGVSTEQKTQIMVFPWNVFGFYTNSVWFNDNWTLLYNFMSPLFDAPCRSSSSWLQLCKRLKLFSRNSWWTHGHAAPHYGSWRGTIICCVRESWTCKRWVGLSHKVLNVWYQSHTFTLNDRYVNINKL